MSSCPQAIPTASAIPRAWTPVDCWAPHSGNSTACRCRPPNRRRLSSRYRRWSRCRLPSRYRPLNCRQPPNCRRPRRRPARRRVPRSHYRWVVRRRPSRRRQRPRRPPSLQDCKIRRHPPRRCRPRRSREKPSSPPAGCRRGFHRYWSPTTARQSTPFRRFRQRAARKSETTTSAVERSPDFRRRPLPAPRQWVASSGIPRTCPTMHRLSVSHRRTPAFPPGLLSTPRQAQQRRARLPSL